MKPRSWIVVLLVLVASACSTPTKSATSKRKRDTTTTPIDSDPVLVALGDSVPHGTACQCTPYPQLTAGDVAPVVRRKIEVFNDAVAGYRSSDVLQQVEQDGNVIDGIKTADAVMLEVGANDIAHTSACGTEVSCYEPELPQVDTNIRQIVSRVHELAGGRRVALILLDYWSVWLGGEYAAAQGPAYVDAAKSLTLSFNQLLRSIASSTGSIYVDVRRAFRGPDDYWDETHLLAPDGEHPNAAGHARIAKAIEATVLSG
jgi:lysophospholipase L1-like esterase